MNNKKIDINEFDELYQGWLEKFKDNILLKKIAQELKDGLPDEKVQHEIKTLFNLLHSRTILNEKSMGEKSLIGVLPRNLAIDGRDSTQHLVKHFTSFALELFSDYLKEKVDAGELTAEEMEEQFRSSEHITQAISDAVNQNNHDVMEECKRSRSK